MPAKWLTRDRIAIVEQVIDWRDAINISARPLLAEGVITSGYVQAIITSHEAIGPYYVLAPGLAMPHARPEEGVNQPALSLLHIRQGVDFGSEENDPVRVVILLCAQNGDEHLAMISRLAELFSDEADLQALLLADNYSAIQALIDKYSL
ncbi:PTS sugar transporter subunit IIA [Acerihabitans sp. TG2]|uniref:PTS sugar transporter subunit IIA n=1 Tax=Acerihabitans sp. TG2 TaxID=3096008 RepID=UPI002B22C416|nr:PTS sugar transporter subunit IIA [Acerihabitans sp. TG2]MEA9391305.1 PTS sugar transporter subunit IIA [Acerihabitans sp. TG2]